MISGTVSTPLASLALDDLLEAIRARVASGERLRTGFGREGEFSDYLDLVKVETQMASKFCAAVAEGIRAETQTLPTHDGWLERMHARLVRIGDEQEVGS